MSYIDTIINRRMDIADPQTFKIVGVPDHPARTINLEPHDLPAAHIIKITNGKMHGIEAPGFFAPYRSPTAWTWDPVVEPEIPTSPL